MLACSCGSKHLNDVPIAVRCNAVSRRLSADLLSKTQASASLPAKVLLACPRVQAIAILVYPALAAAVSHAQHLPQPGQGLPGAPCSVLRPAHRCSTPAHANAVRV